MLQVQIFRIQYKNIRFGETMFNNTKKVIEIMALIMICVSH